MSEFQLAARFQRRALPVPPRSRWSGLWQVRAQIWSMNGFEVLHEVLQHGVRQVNSSNLRAPSYGLAVRELMPIARGCRNT